MLMHVPDAERAFAEMVRVVRREAGYLCLILTGRRLKWSIVMAPARSNGGDRQRLFRVLRHLRKLSKAFNRRHDPSKERLIAW